MVILRPRYKKGVRKIKYGRAGRKISRNVTYFRDIPCQKDLYRAYYIGFRYNLIKSYTDILGAIILKWLKEDIISIEEKEKKGIFKKENTIIVLKNIDSKQIVDTKELELLKMLKSASKDGYLESNEFEQWCQKRYSKILNWFESIIHREEKKLFEEGLIKRSRNILGKVTREATMELKQEAIELAGFKRYLKEYSLIKEREAVEVEVFEEYLIYAQMLGIAKKVAKQFQKIYPEIIQQSSFTSYDYIMFVHMSSHRGISAANTAKSRASSYSSGGGGFSSGGGGGGSFGGGGGGRRFQIKSLR